MIFVRQFANWLSVRRLARKVPALFSWGLLLAAGCSESPPPMPPVSAVSPTNPVPAAQGTRPSATPPPVDLTSTEVVDAAKLPQLADPLPLLDGGRLEVAGPDGWTLPARDPKWLVRFQAIAGTPYPTILVTGEDTTGWSEVSAANVAEFAQFLQQQIYDELSPKGLTVPRVRPLSVGSFQGASYTRQAKAGNHQLERLFLVTVHNGRKYTIEAQAYFGTLDETRPQALAVAAGLKFHDKDGAGGETPAANP